MHPLKRFIQGLNHDSSASGEYLQKRRDLASEVGVSIGSLHNFHNPKQKTKASVDTALRLELATKGQVPAESVCTPGYVTETMRLVELVLAQRAGNSEKKKRKGALRQGGFRSCFRAIRRGINGEDRVG